MPESMFYLIGGIIIGIFVFTIGYRFITISIIQYQKQTALTTFNDFATDMDTVCLQEVGNSMTKKIQLPYSVRVFYVTDDTKTMLPTVTDKINSGETSEGNNLCMQFKNEQYLHCKKLSCNSLIPFIGAMETYNDFQLMVKKILGEALVKDHSLLLEKIGTEVKATVIE